MAEGRIKWYSHQLGHGFIICEDPLADVFMRSEDIAVGDPWAFDAGVKVTFDVVDSPQGKEARNVSRVS